MQRGNLTKIILLNAAAFGVVLGQEGAEEYQCGVLDQAKKLSSGDFDTIHTDYYDLSWDDWDNNLMPKKMHWHIYAIPDDETPRFSTFPDGLLEARVSNGKLEFKQPHDFLKDRGYSDGDRIKVSVNIFVPVSKLTKLKVDGVDQSIEVIATDEDVFTSSLHWTHSMDVSVSGVDTELFVNAPFSKVELSGSGVDNKIVIHSASGSVRLSGVDQDVRIESDYLSDIRVSGVDQKLLLEGDYADAELSGVDIRLRVNGPTMCNKVRDRGTNSNCQTTNDNVTIEELACLADTKVVTSWGLSLAAWIGIAIAVVVVLSLCVSLCVCCCCAPVWCVLPFCNKASRKPQVATVSPSPTTTSSIAFPNETETVEAKIISIENENEDERDPEQPMMAK